MNVAKIDYQSYVGREQELRETRDYIRKIGAPREHEKLFEIELARIEMLKKIKATTGLEFNASNIAANDNASGKVAAFVEPEKDFEPSIEETTLDLPEHQVLKIAEHEKVHIDSKVDSLDPQAFLETADYDALKEFLKVRDLSEQDLIEGFTDAITNERVGKNELSAYQEREVPLAEKLQNAAREKIGKDLFAIFVSGDKSNFQNAIHELARHLFTEKEIEKLRESLREAA